jgi:hypothetical protein
MATLVASFFEGKKPLQLGEGLSPLSMPRQLAFAATLILLAGLALTGCGGNAKNPNAPTPLYSGTPINTYTLTVKATSGSTTQFQPLTLTVQ